MGRSSTKTSGLACRGRCEDEVRALNRIIERNKTAYEKTRGAYVRTALFYGVVGLVFLTGAVADWREFAYVLYPASAIFFFSAWLHFSTGRRYERECLRPRRWCARSLRPIGQVRRRLRL